MAAVVTKSLLGDWFIGESKRIRLLRRGRGGGGEVKADDLLSNQDVLWS